MSDTAYRSMLEHWNQQYTETNALYHEVAVRFGLSDSAFWLLYALRPLPPDAACTQNELSATCCLPKQTVNSAVSAMVQRGMVVLRPVPGARNAKAVCLTDAGRALVERTIVPLYRAEQTALAELGPDGSRQLLALSQSFLDNLRAAFAMLPAPDTEEP